MSEQSTRLTKKDLEKQAGLPEVYKKALEHALYETSLPDDPEDAIWPEYFRAEVVLTESGSELHEWDKLDDLEYCTEANWFQAGWKARDKAKL